MKSFTITAIIVVALTSCVGTKVPKSKMADVMDIADEADGRWTATKEGRSGVDRNWVMRFKDTKLEQLVNEALVRNADIRVAAENVKQAQQTAYLAGASSRVMANVGLTGDRRRINFISFPFGGSQTATTTTTQGLDFNVDWEPDIWGRVGAGVSAAVADAQAVELELRAAKASLVANLCRAWFALCEANEQVQLAEEAHVIRVSTLEAVRDRFELAVDDVGAAAAELRIAKTDIATSLATTVQRQGDVEAAQRQVELLVGRYPSASITGHLKLPEIPKSPPAGLPSELLLRRPDVLASERRYVASGERIKEARRAIFPVFSLTGTTGTSADALTSILDSKFGVWSIGSNITQSILTGGRVKGEIERRSSVDRQALAQLQSTVLNAFGEVESALAADKWLALRITETLNAKKLADEATQSVVEEFSFGNVNLVTVLTSQNRQIDIASQLVLLKRFQLENRVNLHLALGGEFKIQKGTK